ncbi:mucin-2-like isoform X11 [Drosophila innubila]|uniref:mucin-2-like isoform X11 n=1 Tax=Drosophila innubila TaxID=198719 RepID=UPI00148CD6D5|nr:mucin-2-like isoform X11 [Drosophila innubila]
MKSLHSQLVAFVAVAIVVQSTNAEHRQQRPSCESLVEGTHLPDPSRCAGYYICTSGKAVHHSCRSGQFYDEVHQSCQLINLVNCVDFHGLGRRVSARLKPAADPPKEPFSTTAAPCAETTKPPCDKPKTTTPCNIKTPPPTTTCEPSKPEPQTTTPCEPEKPPTTTPCAPASTTTTTCAPPPPPTTTTTCAPPPTTTTPCEPSTTTSCAPPTTTPCEPSTTTSCAPPKTTPCGPPTTTPCEPSTTTPCEPSTTTSCAPPTTTSCGPPTTTPCAPPKTTPCAPPTTTPCGPPRTTPCAPTTTTPCGCGPPRTTPCAPATTTPCHPAITTPCDLPRTTTCEPTTIAPAKPSLLDKLIHKPLLNLLSLSNKDCLLRTDGTFLQDSRHCRRYYECQGGVRKLHSCRSGSWFDIEAGECRNRSLVLNCAAQRN